MNFPKAVLFDLDGVLVDACDWHYEALNFALLENGHPPISKEDHISTYNGLPTSVKLQMLGMTVGESLTINQRKQYHTLATIKKVATVMTEKIELLSYLKQNNILIGCVTNSIRETATEMLNRTGQLHFFDLLVSNEDVSRNKPYPDCYIYAIEKLKVNPSEVICVEDSDKGSMAAINSGAKYLWRVKSPTEVVLKNFRRFIHENFDPNGR
jgi:HAD superfamily hydrolase (TIGR01509 family)